MNDEDRERQRRREQKRKREERRRRRYRIVMIRRCIAAAVGILILVGVFFLIRSGVRAIMRRTETNDTTVTSGTNVETQNVGADESGPSNGNMVVNAKPNHVADDMKADAESARPESEDAESEETESEETLDAAAYAFQKTDETKALSSEEVTATYAILLDADAHEVVAYKNAYERMNPASMTKLLTILVAADEIPKEKLEDVVAVPFEAVDFAFSHDCSNAGFDVDEPVTVNDLFYGTILPSGGDAAMALAIYTAGSAEDFVELMNEKLADLGLSETAHFTNCVGIYNSDHYCSTYDMAVIMGACMQNDYLREVLNARTYLTSKTEAHPEGLLLSNWFMRRIEDKDCGGEVLGAKTGYVDESGSCAASFYKSDKGTEYICVTADSHSSWRCIYDHVAVYNIYAAGNSGYKK